MAAAMIAMTVARNLKRAILCRKMPEMRWAVGWATALALALGCSSPLAPQRPLAGTDAAVDRAARPSGATAVDAARDVGRGPSLIDAAPDFLGRGELVPIGAACRSASDCLTGFCVDGVCCSSACTGPCVTCSALGAMGTCLPVDLGAPAPLGGCPAEGAATCGRTGGCDGVGGCELYPEGTLCMQGTCVDGTTLQAPSTCDGLGACRPGPTQSCAPYTCASGVCQVDDCRFNPADCVSTGNHDASSD